MKNHWKLFLITALAFTSLPAAKGAGLTDPASDIGVLQGLQFPSAGVSIANDKSICKISFGDTSCGGCSSAFSLIMTATLKPNQTQFEATFLDVAFRNESTGGPVSTGSLGLGESPENTAPWNAPTPLDAGQREFIESNAGTSSEYPGSRMILTLDKNNSHIVNSVQIDGVDCTRVP